MELTASQHHEYIEKGYSCPLCSSDVVADSDRDEFGNNVVLRTVKCTGCNAVFNETYTLTYVEIAEEPNGESN